MDNKIPYHSVVIIGAGISGLTAARELVTQYPDLLVVEARAAERRSSMRGVCFPPYACISNCLLASRKLFKSCSSTEEKEAQVSPTAW